MNIALNATQSDTKDGSLILPASVDLTGKEGYLLKIVSASGKPKYALPTGVNDFAPFICGSGDVAGNDSSGEAPSLAGNCRIKLKGACVPGDELALADPSTPADAGKVRKRLATTGTWRTLFIAEETGADGQFVKCRPVPERVTVVS